ncbi:hypothetical protein [Streptomyces sp. NBC_00086]|nr:hypothetical protein [Streptomyces sp. NBC_00086]
MQQTYKAALNGYAVSLSDMVAYACTAVREAARDGAERHHRNPLPTV